MADYYLKNLAPFLARAVKDLGKMKRDDNCGVGSGSKVTFRTNYFPVKINSLTAYVAEVSATVSDYDYTYGTFTLVTPPTTGQLVTANYIYYSWPDGLLQDYIADAVIRIEALVYNQGYVVQRDPTTDDAYLESEPNQATKMLYVIQATIDFANADIASDGLVSTRSFKDDELQQDYTRSAQLTRAYLDNLYRERDRLAETLVADDSDYGYLLETKLNTDEAKYRYLTSLRADGGYESVG